jgi:hypothetical protein
MAREHGIPPVADAVEAIVLRPKDSVGRRCVGTVYPIADCEGTGLDGVSPHRGLPQPGRSPALSFGRDTARPYPAARAKGPLPNQSRTMPWRYRRPTARALKGQAMPAALNGNEGRPRVMPIRVVPPRWGL